MDIRGLHSVYFIGIGGIGMSALARYFHARGCSVSGYDKTPSDMTAALLEEGIDVRFEDRLDTLNQDAELVIYTPAIPSDHTQLSWYVEHGYTVVKRARVLGAIVNELRGLAIAGSHGKTSTSAILNHILQVANMDAAAFLGGVSLNYHSNFHPGETWAVAEADEFDRSFHQLHPEGAIITSVDTDHLDVYGNYAAIVESFGVFAGQVAGTLVVNRDVPQAVVDKTGARETLSYGWDDRAQFYPARLEVREGAFHYDVATPSGTVAGLEMRGGGRHNVENSIGALALAQAIGVGEGSIREAIRTYRGVRRRFEIHIQRKDFVYIDDYAHHPREIEVTLQTARELFPGRRLTVVFQPHLYTRTRDLAEGLAEALSLADEVLLMDIYPAREKPIEGIDSGVIYRLLTKTKDLAPKNQVITQLDRLKPELLITMGAGDIDTLVQPIVNHYTDQ